MKKKIYLAIPYTGIEEKSFKTANFIAGKLMSRGHIVYSPISHSHPIACQCSLPTDWNFWRRFDESFIEWCDELRVVCLSGYLESTGVNAEIKIAKKMNKPVKFISPQTKNSKGKE